MVLSDSVKDVFLSVDRTSDKKHHTMSNELAVDPWIFNFFPRATTLVTVMSPRFTRELFFNLLVHHFLHPTLPQTDSTDRHFRIKEITLSNREKTRRQGWGTQSHLKIFGKLNSEEDFYIHI